MGEEDVVKLLLARDDVDINTRTEPPFSMTPLYVATKGGHLEVMRILLQGGADIKIWSSEPWSRGGTALNCALSRLDAASTELLVEAGADPDSRDENDSPVIFRAAKVPRTNSSRSAAQIVKLLHKHGANLEVRDNSQSTLLHVAAEACDLDAVEMLLAEGLDPDAVDRMGQKPLDRVLDRLPPLFPKSVTARDEFHARQSAIVQLLSKSVSRLDSIEHSGETPLINVSSEQPQRGKSRTSLDTQAKRRPFPWL